MPHSAALESNWWLCRWILLALDHLHKCRCTPVSPVVVASISIQGVGTYFESFHDLTCCQYPLEMPWSYSETCRLVVFSHPDVCRCHQHTELRLCLKSEAYLLRRERIGKQYWSSAGEKVAVCLQTCPEPVEGAGKPANECSSLSLGLFYLLNCDHLNLCAINICDCPNECHLSC